MKTKKKIRNLKAKKSELQDRLAAASERVQELNSYVSWLLVTYGHHDEEGVFCFPNGEIWDVPVKADVQVDFSSSTLTPVCWRCKTPMPQYTWPAEPICDECYKIEVAKNEMMAPTLADPTIP